MKVEPDDFAIWRDNPITQAVFKALRIKADEAKQQWLAASWDQGICDERLRSDLHARAEIANDVCELTHSDLEKIIGDERT